MRSPQAASAFGFSGPGRGPTRRSPDRFIRGKILVRFPSPAVGSQAAGSLAALGARQASAFNANAEATFEIPSGLDPPVTAASLRKMPGIVDARPLVARYLQDVTPNDPDYGNVKQWDMFAINMHCAWGVTLGSPSILIGVIDTGADLTHPDLVSKIVKSAAFVNGNGTQATPPATAQDNDGHGTNVSGIAAADTNNLIDVAGTGFNVRLLEARVFPYASPSATPLASDLDVAAGITWAVSNGAKVVNLSLGGSCPDPPEASAIAAAIAAGVVVVAASGNTLPQGTATLDCPAADTGVIAVGASALHDTTKNTPSTAKEVIASYSNFGTGLAVVAPGGDPDAAQIACTTSSCIDFLQWILNLYSITAPPGGDTLALFAGTSQATPHVSGIAALMASKNPAISPASVKSILESTADNICSCVKQGSGRVNAIKALIATP